MSTLSITILPKGHHDLRLRSINSNDLENLRQWKNENKQSFFMNQDITAEQQQKWYSNFSERPDDHMFIVEQLDSENWVPIGCMGYRKLDDERCVDCYNIIRAVRLQPASFTMTDAFGTMLSYTAKNYPGLPIQVKVLSGNPAVSWYERNGFSKLYEKENYFLMELDKEFTKLYNWTIK
jgi:hypothetical protein